MSTPGDAHEREAERVADTVMGIPQARTQIQQGDVETGGGEPGLAASPQPVIWPAHPLNQFPRRFMEARFGHDFSQVQVHSDAKAAESARSIHALAFTVGRDIVFGAGQYAPNTHRGLHLLAHELAHVVKHRNDQSVIHRQAVVPATRPATEVDRRDFVRTTIRFFDSSADFFGDPLVKIDPAVFERVINNWYLMVESREAMINTDLGRDASLIRDLRAAYTAAIRVLIGRAAKIFNQPEETLYRENSGRIPMWAWPTPHKSESGISTPIPESQGVDVITGNVGFASNGFEVTILPDAANPALRSPAETTIAINWQLPAYRTQGRRGHMRVTAFDPPAPVTARIQTFYGSGVTAASLSGYGRGTTRQDIAGGRVSPRSTTLGFHEGSHGLAFVEFIQANPAPQFKGAVGMTEAQFRAARVQWDTEMRDYSRRIKAFSTTLVDCVGTTIDQFNRSAAARGAVVRLVCGP